MASLQDTLLELSLAVTGGGVVAGLATWWWDRRHRGKRIPANLVQGRDEVSSAIARMFKLATKGDVIFGECRSCDTLGAKFYENLSTALGKGAKLEVKTSPLGPDSIEGVQIFLGYVNTEVRAARIGAVRLIGIERKDAFLIVNHKGEYFGVHFEGPAVAEEFYGAFKEVWDDLPRITKVEVETYLGTSAH